MEGGVEGVLTLEDVDLKGKTILYRVDVNSPLEPSTGRLLDDGRLRGVVPTPVSYTHLTLPTKTIV